MKPKTITTLDKIIEHLGDLTGTVALTTNEQHQMERIDFADNLIRAGYKDQIIVERLMKKYEIGKTAAYKYISMSISAHGSTRIVNKGYEVYDLLQECRHAIRLARENNNLTQFIKAIEAKAKVLSLIPEETENPFKTLEQNNYYMVINGKGKTPALRINMNTVSKLSAEEASLLMEQVNENLIEASGVVLESHLMNGHG